MLQPSSDGSAHERHDRLEVVTVGKEIERTHVGDLVAGVGEQPSIPSQSDGIAGHIDHLRRLQLRQVGDDLLARTRARRVEHDQRTPVHRGGRLLRLTMQKPLDRLTARVDAFELAGVDVGQLAGTLVGLDCGDRQACSCEPHGEEPDAAVEVEVGCVRVDPIDGDKARHRVDQRGRRITMHLPEPALVDLKLDTVHPTHDRCAVSAVEHDACATGPVEVFALVEHQLHGLVALAQPAVNAQLFELVDGQRQMLDRNDRVGTRRVGADPPFGVDVQQLAGAPAPPGSVIGVESRQIDGIARCRVPDGRDIEIPGRHGIRIEVADALEGVPQHDALELALARQGDMPEVGAAGPDLGLTTDVAFGQHLTAAIRGCLQDFERDGSGESWLRLGQAGTHSLAGHGVGHEHDAARVTRDEDALMSDAGNIEIDHVADLRLRVTRRTGLDVRRLAAGVLGVRLRFGKGLLMHINDSTAPTAAPARRPRVPFVLASTSPARLATMRSAGIEPVVVPSHVDEDAVVAAAGLAGDSVVEGRDRTVDGGGRTAQIVSTLARAKARAVLTPEVNGLVLGGDSMFEIDGVPLGKPHTPQRAAERIRQMRGRAGTLYSGHWLVDHRGGSTIAEAGAWDSATVTFDDISDAEIEAYVATGEPLEVAGSFTVDGLGQAFITSVQGAPSCVIGLSVPVVRRLAAQLGVFWPDLWNIGAARD